MTEPGQTDEYGVSEHINAIIEHCGSGIVDYCIYDTGEIVPEFIKKYNLEGQYLVEPDIDKIKGITFLQRNLSMVSKCCIRHDPDLVAGAVIELICDDLKYQDKQNDPQYLMLNNKLREDKRISKIKKRMAKEASKTDMQDKTNTESKRSSKFKDKYSDRIKSIKQSDEMIKLKEQKIKKEKQIIKELQKSGKMQEDEETLRFRKEYEEVMKQPVTTKNTINQRNNTNTRHKNKKGKRSKNRKRYY